MEEQRIGWVGQATLVGASTFGVLGFYSYGVVLPQIAQAFAGTPHAAFLSQMVGGVVGFAFAVGSPWMGALVDRYGYARVYLWSAIVFALAGTSAMLLDNIYAILATRIVVGVAVAGAIVASLAGIGTLSEAQRGRLFGFHALVGGALAVLAYFVVSRLALYGWRPPFALHLIGLLLIPFILMLPRHIAAPAIVSAARPGGGLQGLPLTFLAVILFVGMAQGLPGLFSPFYLTSIGIHDPTRFAIPLMACAAAAVPAAGTFGWVQGRLGIGGTFALTLFAIGLGFVASGYTASVATLSATLAFAAIGLTLFSPNVNAAAVALAIGNHGRAIGLANGVMYGAQALFPFVAQAMNQAAGPAAVFFGFGAIALAIGVGYLVLALSRRPIAAEA